MAEIKKVYKNWTAYDVLNSDTVVDAVIPSQTWNSWKFLTTDGSDVSWANVDALPSQTGQSWKFLTTNWTTASWANPVETTKIFTLSSISDLTTAQAAYDFKESWWSPILVLYWMYFYYYNNNKFFYVDSQWPNTSWNWLQWRVLSLTVSSWTVTAISSISNTIRVSTSAPTSIFGNDCITFVI